MPSSRPLPRGKLPPELLRQVLGDSASWPREVILGPRVGEDACAIRLSEGTLVAATDPITLTGQDLGRYAVQINANDVAVCGVRPRWFLASVLLPPGTDEATVVSLFREMRGALDDIGATLVGGHTEVTAAVMQPVVVGQMLGHTTGEVVRTGGLQPGDVVLQIGPAPIEGAAVLAAAHRELDGIAPETRAAAAAAVDQPGISVVDAALRCAELGATALHDPTEGGLATGLRELADASSVGLAIDARAVLWFEPGVAICRALELDPWGVLASGCLLAGFAPDRAEATRAALEADGHLVARIGFARARAGIELGDGTPLPTFERDEVARVGDS